MIFKFAWNGVLLASVHPLFPGTWALLLTYSCFDCLSFTPLLRKGSPSQRNGDSQTHDTWPWTDELDSSLLVSCTHSLADEDAGQPRGHTLEQREPAGVVRSRLRSIKRVWCPLIPTGVRLACLNNSAGWQGIHYSGMSSNCACSPC